MGENNNFISLDTYEDISMMLKTNSYDDILESVANNFNISASYLENYPMGGYSKGRESGEYKYVLIDLIKNIYQYDKVYSLLADDISREVFTRLMQFRVMPDLRFIELACDSVNHQYFDKSIVKCDDNEVFVDCGGFTGDTAEDYISQYHDYKRIYVYEPSDDNIMKCCENLSKYQNVVVRNSGVGEKNQDLMISNSTSSSSFVGVNDGDDVIKIISLDEDIKEPVTFIKMDIEGFEIPAIIGAKNHIKNDSPKLAICTYHIISDMWEIPLLIHAINPDYRLYFRHYRPDQNWETVLYAVIEKKPEHKIKVTEKIRHAVAVPDKEGWKNVELTKDCGLIPYLLYKNHNMDVTMIGRCCDEYSYNDKYTKGLKMEFLQTGSAEEQLKYIRENAADIDLLIFRGAYIQNSELASEYKRLNPSGKIYVGLDANSGWMDRIIWKHEPFIRYMECCDLIATSCHAMQKHLNGKWPWKIEFIPNGFYKFGHQCDVPEFAEKKNIILTVSRLGTEQKATDVLLKAFALVAEKESDWTLRLVGNIDEKFDDFIEQYFRENPEMIDRIDFVGPLTDKNALYSEYLNAKIFALPSLFEGGTPNVIAEALSAGCVPAVTKFDAWEDAVDYGRCGMASEIGDVKGFADILLRLTEDKNLDVLSQKAYQYALRYFNMESVVAKINEALFGGE